jgi:hypothetical protein
VSEPVTTTETTYTFEGLVAGPYYTIYVKALPATEANTESEYASVGNVQVYNDPASMETKYTFTKAVNTGSNKIKFSNENGEYCVIKFAASLTSIAPGMYTSNASGDFYVDNWSSGFNGGSQIFPFSFVNVEGEAGADQTVTIVGAESYGGEQVKAVFTGVIDMEVAVVPGFVSPTTLSVIDNGNDVYFTFNDEYGNTLSINVYNGAPYNYYPYCYYQPFGADQLALSTVVCDYTKVADGEYTFNNVSVVVNDGYAINFSNVTFKDGVLVGEGGSDEGGSDEGGSDEGGSDEGAVATLTYVDGAGGAYEPAFFSCEGAYNGYVRIGLSSGLVDGTYELAGNSYSGYGTSVLSMNSFEDGTVTISGSTIVVVWTVDGVQVTATGTF